jgi:DNA-binding XRE family transcriptional regulator
VTDVVFVQHGGVVAIWRRVHTAEELGAAIVALRKERGMSQEELAAWVGVNRTTLIRMEAGRVPQLVRLMTALATLGADVVVLDRTAEATVGEPARSADRGEATRG